MSQRVLHVSSEVYPFSKTGGLADVLGALPLEQARLGAEVMVLSPWYGSLAGPQPTSVGQVEVPGAVPDAELGEVWHEGVRHLFLRQPGFAGETLYGLENDIQRFTYFCKALPYVVDSLGLAPRIIHAHDWASGLIPALLRFTHVPSSLHGVRTVFTIHNLEYQGRWNPWEVLAWTGLPSSLLHADTLEFFGDINLLKAGIVCADAVTTVSPTYAHEITGLEHGEKLEGVLRRVQREGRLHGILNGLDMERWNPQTDPYCAFDTLEGKRAVKLALLEQLGLPDRPTLGIVSRFAHQKGMDLVLEALEGLLEGWNLVMLGSGDPRLERLFKLLGRHVPGLSYHSGYDEALSHRIYAASDAFLMPSRFEPCGLSQMIAQRYGSLPIVRDTGGLHDTVSPDIGFLFPEASAESLLGGTAQALEVYGQRPEEWQARVQRGMALDWSWRRGAEQYLALYAQVLSR